MCPRLAPESIIPISHFRIKDKSALQQYRPCGGIWHNYSFYELFVSRLVSWKSYKHVLLWTQSANKSVIVVAREVHWHFDLGQKRTKFIEALLRSGLWRFILFSSTICEFNYLSFSEMVVWHTYVCRRQRYLSHVCSLFALFVFKALLWVLQPGSRTSLFGKVVQMTSTACLLDRPSTVLVIRPIAFVCLLVF